MKQVPVEVYSRVVGYFRPVHQWNKGKQEEFSARRLADPKSPSLYEERVSNETV